MEGGSPLIPTNSKMTQQTSLTTARSQRFHRREPGLATIILGFAIMLITLVLPMEHRAFAFYPALVVIGAGILLTLRHGPDEPQKD